MHSRLSVSETHAATAPSSLPLVVPRLEAPLPSIPSSLSLPPMRPMLQSGGVDISRCFDEISHASQSWWMDNGSELEDAKRALISGGEAHREQVWHQLTGELPSESKIAICIPARNEEERLVSTLSAVLLGHLPQSVDTLIMIVLNGTVDGSRDRVERFLQELQAARMVPAHPKAGNPFEALYLIGDTKIGIIECSGKGKCAAVSLASRVAECAGYKGLISIDADCTLGLRAVAEMYRDLGTATDRQIPLVFGEKRMEEGTSAFAVKYKRGTFVWAVRNLLMPDRRPNGPLFALDTRWLNVRGGVPNSAIEDFALEILAESFGQRPARSLAATWAEERRGLLNLICASRRAIRGEFQMLEAFSKDGNEEAVRIAKESFPPLQSRMNRWRRFCSCFPEWTNRLRNLPAFICAEALVSLGKRDFRKSGGDASWIPPQR